MNFSVVVRTTKISTMSLFKYIPIIMFVSLMYVYSPLDISIVRHRRSMCIIDLGNFFNLPIPTTMYSDQNEIDSFLTSTQCAKNAIIYKKSKLTDYEYQLNLNIHGRAYYLYFRQKLNSVNVPDPFEFCKNYRKYVRVPQPTGVPQPTDVPQPIDLEILPICMEQLHGFPISAQDSVIYAFYDVVLEEFSQKPYGHKYMEYIIEHVILVDIESPAVFCHKRVSEDTATSSTSVPNDL